MRYEGITVNGTCVDLGNPIKVKLTMDENQPADTFFGVFLDQDSLPAFLHWNIYDGDTLIFGGIVDTQQREYSENGRLVKLTARSKAALLLDNEAKPQTYLHPSLPELFQNHGAPYGLQKFKGKTASFHWNYVVRKGISEWQVFWDFCLYCIGIEPRVTPDGVLDVTGEKSRKVLYFSNNGGIQYVSLMHNRSPEKRLSQLCLQEKLGDGYTSTMMDLAAVQAGIQRSRYVTVADWQGRRKLKQSRRSSDALVLVCPGGICGELGMQAVVEDPHLGIFRNYSVACLCYTLDDNGEQCTVTLCTDL